MKKKKMKMTMTMTMAMRKKIIYIVNNSTNFDIFPISIPSKPLCVALSQHFDD